MTDKPYAGNERKLILAFDVGTTFSGISYTILTPGEVPKILGVNRFPAQENVGGDSKIPTILYYDKYGKPRAIGAEALDPFNVELADDEGWKKVEWFKMHLRPKSMGSSVDGTKIPALPSKKAIVEVFADFLSYLLACAQTYITETHAAGDVLWKSLENSIHFVLTHPNGWTGLQQARMRQSAILAGLVPDTPEGRMRVQFLTEGEASLHFCINSGLAEDLIKPGNSVIIADAGGGTIDVSSYRFASLDPLKVEESAVPECKSQGSVFVSRRAHEYLKTHLCGSKYGTPESIDEIADIFDKTTKRIFRDKTNPSYVKFAAAKDKDIKFNIRNGQLKLEGHIVASFFENSVRSLVEVIKAQEKAGMQPTAVFLVGGFAASPWLFLQLQEQLAGSPFSLCRPDSHTNKAVADGAISFHLNHIVTERVARVTLGIEMAIKYNGRLEDHSRRSSTAFISADDRRVIPGVFATLLKKDTKILETAEFKSGFCRLSKNRAALNKQAVLIVSYDGTNPPLWMDDEPDHFANFCFVEADVSAVVAKLAPRLSRSGDEYYVMEYEIAIIFGLTETQAVIIWKEDGEEKRSPATIVYDEQYDGLMDDVEDEEESESVEPSDSDENDDGPQTPASEDESPEVVENKETVNDDISDVKLEDEGDPPFRPDDITKDDHVQPESKPDAVKEKNADHDDWELA